MVGPTVCAASNDSTVDQPSSEQKPIYEVLSFLRDRKDPIDVACYDDEKGDPFYIAPRLHREVVGVLGIDWRWSPKHGLVLSDEHAGACFRIGGRLRVDATNFFKSLNNFRGDGVSLRDSRIEMRGTFSEDWGFRMDVGGVGSNQGDFRSSVENFYVRYSGWQSTAVTVGQQSELFGLEEQTSALARGFMEVSLPTSAFAPGKRIGLNVSTFGEGWTAGGGIFFEDIAADEELSDQGRGLTGRFTATPFDAGSMLLHLGASASYREVPSDEIVRFRARPEFRAGNVILVDTGKLAGVGSVLLTGLELALIEGPFSIQAELMRAQTFGSPAAADHVFHGWYVHGSWLPLGGSRPYLDRYGKLGRVLPQEDVGAPEIALRYSEVNLTDGVALGGTERNITLGANWYFNTNVRLMSNLIIVDPDTEADGNGSLIGGDAFEVIMLRLELNI